MQHSKMRYDLEKRNFMVREYQKFNSIVKVQRAWRTKDLNPCDFFLWGYLKARVYHPMPLTLDNLKENLEREIKNIKKRHIKIDFFKFYQNIKKGVLW